MLTCAQGLQGLSQDDQQAIAHVWSVFSASPAKQRQLMLQGILAQCCFPQLSYLSTKVKDLIRIDFLTALPTEIAFKILCYLDTTSLCKAAQVSRRWRTLADDDVVWHRMCEQHIDRRCEKCGWGLPLLERKLLRSRKREIQLRAVGRGLNEWSPNVTPSREMAPKPSLSQIINPLAAEGDDDEGSKSDISTLGLSSKSEYRDSGFRPKTRPWKDVYKDRFLIGTNWKYGRYNLKILRGHTNGIMCLQFDENILATGSYDATIKIWDIKTGDELQTLRGHSSGIRCLQFDDSKLISGSIDRTVKIWNWRTGECMSTYTGHSNGIVGLHFDSALLATGSMDKTIKIWNFEDKSTFVLRGHNDWVNSVRIDTLSRTCLSASDDCTVKLWDLDSRACVKTLEGHVGQVQQVVTLPHDFEFNEEDVKDSGEDGTSSSNASGAASPSHSPQPPPHTHPQAHAHDPQTQDPSSPSALNGGTALPTTTSEPYEPDFSASRPLPPRYILTSALDSTIRLWDTQTARCLRTYFGHVEGVWALAADTLRLVSGSEDRTVKVWDIRSGRCEKNFTGHVGPVTCIGLSDRVLCTAGEDCEVRVYSF